MNKIMLQGRLVRDPEMSPSGSEEVKRMRCVFSLAVKRDFKKAGGPDADFFRCVAFGQSASYLVDNGRKGGRLLVEGRVEINTVDNDNGSRSVYAQVIVDRLWIIDYREGSYPAMYAPPCDPEADAEFFASIPDPSEVPFLNGGCTA